LRRKNLRFVSKSRPFSGIEPDITCALIDLRKEELPESVTELLDIGYDVGSADVAHIPFAIVVSDEDIIPDIWEGCINIYTTQISNLKELLEIFVRSVKKFEDKWKLATRAPLEERRNLRQDILNMIHRISTDEIERYVSEKRSGLLS